MFQTPCSQYDSSEKENFSTLVLELSVALRAHNLEFSTMVSATPEIAQVAYDHNVLAVAADWIAIAANDYYASTTGRTGYLVPLETPEADGINSFVSNQTEFLYKFMNVSDD